MEGHVVKSADGAGNIGVSGLSPQVLDAERDKLSKGHGGLIP
jgi:hypothetical protein